MKSFPESPYHETEGSAAASAARVAIEVEQSHLALQKALVEIKSSEDKLRTIIDTIPALAWTARPDGSAEFFNRRWLDYSGLSAEEASGSGWTSAVHSDDLNRVVDYWRSILASGESGEIEARLRRFDGVYRWFLFRASPLRDVSGNIVRWYGTNADIEERKRAEEALRSNEQKLRLIVDTIPGMVCTMSAAGEVQLLNHQVLEYFGKTIEELKNWATSDAVHPDDLPRVIEVWRRSVEAGEPYELELRQRRVDGVYRWFQSRALPARGTEGQITDWYMVLTDIDDRKRAEDALRASEQEFRLIVDSVPGFVWTMTANGEVELVNQQMLGYFGKTLSELKEWTTFLHPDDRARVTAYWRGTTESGQAYDVEHRLRRADGAYRWFQARGLPQRDAYGQIVRWYNLLTDIDDRKRAEDALRSNEQSLRLIVDSIPGFVSTANAAGEVELVNRQVLEYFGKTTEELKNWATSDAIHPDDLPRMIEAYKRSIETGQPRDVETRSRRADGVYRWFHLRSRPQRDAEGRIFRWYNLVTDIDERKKAEEELHRSKAYLTEAQRLSLTGSFGCNLSTGEMFWSDETFRIYGYDRSTQPAVERVLERVHPEDRALVQERIDLAYRDRKDCLVECRLLLPDESVKHVRIVAHASTNELGITEFVGAVMDVTAQRQARAELEQAFEEIARSETELRTIIDAIPQLIIAVAADGNFLSANQAVLEYTGLTREEVGSERFREVFHPEDSERLGDERAAAISRGLPFEYERRVRRRDGQFRWFLIQYNPLLDERGKVIRWCATGTDIDDRKHAEERTREENFALREQIDQVFMFEEIVGSSPALKTVLSSIVKVAPTNSTVLIAGETGTGKELIARAVHRKFGAVWPPFYCG
jgi:PAS domain S-box-containing protein